MLKKIAWIADISRNAADRLNRYLAEFADRMHRPFWTDTRVPIKVDRLRDAYTLRRTFLRSVAGDSRDMDAPFGR